MINQNQRLILIVAGVIIVSMLLYPPFYFSSGYGIIQNKGYAWIFNPPTLSTGVKTNVNISMLVVQFFVVIIVAGIAFFLAKDKNTK